MRSTILAIGLAILAFGGAAADDDVGAGQATLSWLEISCDVRDAAMGGTGALSGGDAASASENPAGLVGVSRTAASVSRVQWIADMTVSDFAFAYRVGGLGVVALTIRSMDYGSFQFTARSDNTDGYVDLAPSDVGDVAGYSLGIAGGSRVTERLSVGCGLEYARDRLGRAAVEGASGDAVMDAVLFDAGTRYRTGWRDVTLSMAAANIGLRQSASNGDAAYLPPVVLRAGMSADVIRAAGVPDGPFRLETRFQWTEALDAHAEQRAGAELRYDASPSLFAALRSGYAWRAQEGLSFGIGVGGRFSGTSAAFSYTYTDFGSVLGGANRFGLTGAF